MGLVVGAVVRFLRNGEIYGSYLPYLFLSLFGVFYLCILPALEGIVKPRCLSLICVGAHPYSFSIRPGEPSSRTGIAPEHPDRSAARLQPHQLYYNQAAVKKVELPICNRG